MTMNITLDHGYITISRLSPAQAKSKDGKGRLAIQGVYATDAATGKGKKAVPETKHEFSFLQPDKPDTKPGRYYWRGFLDIDVEEAPSRTHEVNGVRFARHNAKLNFAGFEQFRPVTGIRPF